MNSQMKRYIGQGPKDQKVLSAGASLSPWSLSVPSCRHVDVFTNPEALGIP